MPKFQPELMHRLERSASWRISQRQLRSRRAYDLARGFAIEFSLPSRVREGAGNAGRAMRPISRMYNNVWKSARDALSGQHRTSPGHSPAQWFYGLYRALPGDRALLPPSPARSHSRAKLDASVGASGPHDFAVRAAHRRQVRTSASTASRSDVRDVAQRPWRSRMATRYKCDLRTSESEIFLRAGRLEGSGSCPGDLPVGTESHIDVDQSS